MINSIKRLLTFYGIVFLTACTTLEGDSTLTDLSHLAKSPWALLAPSGTQLALWQHLGFPGKRLSKFNYELNESRHAIHVDAQSSASMLRHRLLVSPSELGQLKFSWKLPELIPYANMSQREFDDSPVRVVLAFEGDRSKFTPKNTMLSELAHALTGEPMPYATLMYVWCNDCKQGAVILNPHTDRIRKLPLESGPSKLNQWVDYERTVRDDFVSAFGEEPGLLTSISIMTDSDNTKSVARAWYGPIQLERKLP